MIMCIIYNNVYVYKICTHICASVGIDVTHTHTLYMYTKRIRQCLMRRANCMRHMHVYNALMQRHTCMSCTYVLMQ